MCGICGFVGAGDVDILASMNEAMVHRGPDAGGLWHNAHEAVYLGHRRLSIIDLSGGAQPMWTADGTLGIVFNGEIYNHLELREELIRAGHHFLTDHSDTEVLLHGYRQWGHDLPSRLNGMWAFAIYDRKRRELFLSRDRFGKKPLFYSIQNRTFAFASELSALIRHPQITADIHEGSLKKYFAYGYIPAPSTLKTSTDALKTKNPKFAHMVDACSDFLLSKREKLIELKNSLKGVNLEKLFKNMDINTDYSAAAS